jgi:dipeptidyl aminopeptidase/acylaminoacyl peptidase
MRALEASMTRRHWPVAVLSAVLLLLALPRVARSAPPSLDDIVDLVQVSSPQVAPDGSRVLYTRTTLAPWKENKRVSQIWIVRADGSDRHPFLTDDKARDVRWSPDGSLIAFLADRTQEKAGDASDADRGAQIYVIRADGGEARQLTKHKGGIGQYEWAADGTHLFFVADNPETDAERAARKAGDDAIYVDEGPNGQGLGHYNSLWVVNVADGQERRITTDAMLIEDFMPSPDGREIAITFRTENTRNGSYHAEVALVDVANGARHLLTHNQAPERSVSWSPDGRSVAYLAPDNGDWDLAENKLWVVPGSGGTPRLLSGAFNGDIGDYFWAPDGQTIVFGGVDRARGGVYRIEVSSGRVTTIAHGDWSGDLESVTTNRLVGATVRSTPTVAPDVQLVDLKTGTTTALSDANPQVRSWTLAQFRAVTWKSRDGLPIEGMLWLPADYHGGKLPLLLSVHGGPAGVWSTAFRPIDEVYTSLGWAVLEPNVRGTTSYGDKLLDGNMKDIGGGDYQDLVTGVDALVAQGIADPDHLAIRGWSYGGILGGWTITQTTRFKAASLGAMVTDWRSEYAMGFNFDVSRWYIGGTPWDHPDAYLQQSSYTHVAQVTTPTILFHGEHDTTDTIGQSMMFYQALRDRQVPVRFIRFPREPHGFREPHHQRIRDAEEISWLMKYARGIDWKAPERPLEPTTTTKETRGQ